jgi:hypothetical protein
MDGRESFPAWCAPHSRPERWVQGERAGAMRGAASTRRTARKLPAMVAAKVAKGELAERGRHTRWLLPRSPGPGALSVSQVLAGHLV